MWSDYATPIWPTSHSFERPALHRRSAVLQFMHSFALIGQRIPNFRHLQQLLAVVIFLYGACHRAAFGSVLPELSCFKHPKSGPQPGPPRPNNLNFNILEMKSYG